MGCSVMWVIANWNMMVTKKNMPNFMTSQHIMQNTYTIQPQMNQLTPESKGLFLISFILFSGYIYIERERSKYMCGCWLNVCVWNDCSAITLYQTANGELILGNKNKILGHRSLQIFYKQRLRFFVLTLSFSCSRKGQIT
jgi:hypothetical protein